MSTHRLAVIIGSVRRDRFGPTVASWFADEAGKHGAYDVDLIDLADYDIPGVLGGNDPAESLPADVQRLGERLGRADAFVAVTPTYNRSYPGSLKNAIDWFFTEWQLKPVGFVGYGGAFGGFIPIEHLRGVFLEFNAVPLKDAVIVADFWEKFDHDGRPVDSEQLSAWAKPVLDQLAWWSQTLRDGREARPYPAQQQEASG